MSEINYNALKSFGGTALENKLNAVVDALQSVTLCNGVGHTLKRGATGTIITIPKAITPTPASPFDCFIKADPDNLPNGRILKLRAGTVNQLLPSNMFSSFSFTSTDIIQVKVRAVSDGTQITSCSLIVDTSSANPQTPTSFALPTSIDIVIAVIVSGVPTRLIATGKSITLNGVQQFITDTGSAAEAGELTYIPYYTWVIQ